MSIANRDERGTFLNYTSINIFEKRIPKSVRLSDNSLWSSNVFKVYEDYNLYRVKHGLMYSRTGPYFCDFGYARQSINLITPQELRKEMDTLPYAEQSNIIIWFKRELKEEEERIERLKSIISALEKKESKL